MKRWCGSVLALASLGCDSEGYVAVYRDGGELVLPIEVLGKVGTEESREVMLDTQASARASFLALTVHGVSDASEAVVFINAGRAYPLTNETVTLPNLERSFGGIGSFATLHVQLPLDPGSLRPGRNEVSFRFAGGDGTSIGFRVLALNLLDSELRPLLETNRFVEDDPRAWSAPVTDPAASDEGRALWSSATLFDLSSLGPKPLLAHCGDCHAADGRDLKYFNYSNRSIIERSRFYGLTEIQGKAIASYIRSLEAPAPGRPWDPPYQPGPGLDSRDASSWSAGAGLASVLELDEQMAEQLFPHGIDAASISPDDTLNLRELPIALQLPDWNRWLPRIHPLDAWGDAFAADDLNLMYVGSDQVEALSDRLARGGTEYVMQHFADDQKSFTYARSDFLNPRVQAAMAASWPFEERVRIQSVHQWQMVKLWELTQRFGLEVDAREIYGRGAEARSWLGGRFAQQFGIERPGSALEQEYLSSAWFYLQLILNSGNRVAVAHEAVDWVGTYREQAALVSLTSIPEPYRLLAMLVKGTQQATNGIGPDQPSSGWNLERAEAGLLFHPRWEANFAELSDERRRAVAEAYLRGFMEVSERYAPDVYLRGDVAPAFPPASYVATENPDHDRVDAILFMIPRLVKLGVEPQLVQRLCVWAEALWPLAGFDGVC